MRKQLIKEEKQIGKKYKRYLKATKRFYKQLNKQIKDNFQDLAEEEVQLGRELKTILAQLKAVVKKYPEYHEFERGRFAAIYATTCLTYLARAEQATKELIQLARMDDKYVEKLLNDERRFLKGSLPAQKIDAELARYLHEEAIWWSTEHHKFKRIFEDLQTVIECLDRLGTLSKDIISKAGRLAYQIYHLAFRTEASLRAEFKIYMKNMGVSIVPEMDVDPREAIDKRALVELTRKQIGRYTATPIGRMRKKWT